MRRSRHFFTWLAVTLAAACGRAANPAPSLLAALSSPILLQGDNHTAYRDPLLLHELGGFYLFYSWSNDLKTWITGSIDLAHGENPCVIVQNDEYVLFYSPSNGIGVKRSTDLVHWRDAGPPLTFGQAGWPWAETRLTAGYVEDLRGVPGVGKYVMVFHASGPGKVRTELQENANAHLGIAWSDDLKTWDWPGKDRAHPAP